MCCGRWWREVFLSPLCQSGRAKQKSQAVTVARKRGFICQISLARPDVSYPPFYSHPLSILSHFFYFQQRPDWSLFLVPLYFFSIHRQLDGELLNRNDFERVPGVKAAMRFDWMNLFVFPLILSFTDLKKKILSSNEDISPLTPSRPLWDYPIIEHRKRVATFASSFHRPLPAILSPADSRLINQLQGSECA